jgi:hypothetical protein
VARERARSAAAPMCSLTLVQPVRWCDGEREVLTGDSGIPGSEDRFIEGPAQWEKVEGSQV